jgi:hypothetical protein
MAGSPSVIAVKNGMPGGAYLRCTSRFKGRPTRAEGVVGTARWNPAVPPYIGHCLAMAPRERGRRHYLEINR